MTSAAEFHAFGTKETFETEAADWIEARLEDALSRRGKATLFCSGGSTPGPIYEALSGLNLDWEHVTIGLAEITERMTLTYPVVGRARNILLLMSGDKKKSVFEAANPEHPVSLMRRAAGKALTVFYRS